MNLSLDARLGEGYKSASQWARRVTEGWATLNLFCPACPAPNLQVHANNRAVEDYHCPSCRRQVQVKAKNGRLGASVANSAYAKKQAAILDNRAPDYCFVAYNRSQLAVNDVLWVPGHFMTLSVISVRNPLRAKAQRKGWVGSVIHLDRIPSQGKIPLVQDGTTVPPAAVRRQFTETQFVARLPAAKRGWVTDVLACIDSLDVRRGSLFTNDDLYSFEERLRRLHPANSNVRPKIRQQLQVLAAQHVVERVSPGVYRRL